MYLTRMPLNPARRGTRHLLASSQRVHAAVLAGFPPGDDARDGRVLWRLDQPDPGRLDLFVVSPERPDYTHVVEQAGWPTRPTWETARYDAFLARLATSQRWVFRLTANPVRSVRRLPRERGRPTPVGSPAEQERWLVEHAPGWGFRVVEGSAGTPNLRVSDRTKLTFAKQDGDQRRTVTVARAQFDGVLEITDADSLRHSLTHGVGRARAYGCGLLTLAPLP